ncbi:26S proteasome non-ATPase regulatory subunit 9 [Sparganum proliferum]
MESSEPDAGDTKSISNVPRGSIPIYRRGYAARRAATHGTLVWDGGRLRSITEEGNQPKTENMLPFPGAVLGTSSGIGDSSFPADRLTSRVPRGSRRGRPGRSRVGFRGSPAVGLFSDKPGSYVSNEDDSRPSKMCDLSASLPHFVPRDALPTDFTLPVFHLTAEDPLPQTSNLSGNSANPAEPQGTNLTAGPAGFGSKMKSSGMDDIDFELLKNYRRLNGYTLFTIVNRKKYGISDEASDQKSQSRRWQAMWTTLPEKMRKAWGTKARRALKQLQNASEKKAWAENKREAEIRRTAGQLSRAQTTKYSLMDLAAHFKLLSESFERAAALMEDYRGPVAMESVESTLLDGLLTCLIPLTAIAGEIEPLSGAPDRQSVCAGLSNLSHIFPTV